MGGASATGQGLGGMPCGGGEGRRAVDFDFLFISTGGAGVGEPERSGGDPDPCAPLGRRPESVRVCKCSGVSASRASGAPRSVSVGAMRCERFLELERRSGAPERSEAERSEALNLYCSRF